MLKSRTNSYIRPSRLVYEGETMTEELKQTIKTDMSTEIETQESDLFAKIDNGEDIDITAAIENAKTNMDGSLIAAERRAFGDEDDVQDFKAELLGMVQTAKDQIDANAEQYKKEHAFNLAKAKYEADYEANIKPANKKAEPIIEDTNKYLKPLVHITEESDFQTINGMFDTLKGNHETLSTLQTQLNVTNASLILLETLAGTANLSDKTKSLRVDLDKQMAAVNDALPKAAQRYNEYIKLVQDSKQRNMDLAQANIQNYRDESGALQQKRGTGSLVTDKQLMDAYNKYKNQPEFIKSLGKFYEDAAKRQPIGGAPPVS